MNNIGFNILKILSFVMIIFSSLSFVFRTACALDVSIHISNESEKVSDTHWFFGNTPNTMCGPTPLELIIWSIIWILVWIWIYIFISKLLKQKKINNKKNSK